VIASTFPGLFTIDQLGNMDIRLKMWWLMQAEAMRRQQILLIARGVNMGMATPEGFKKALEDLELVVTKDEVVEANWDMLNLLGGKKWPANSM
jgi:hypothetical protein